MTITTGTVVSLRSGGPYMTVTSLKERGEIVVCSWFDTVGENQVDTLFHADLPVTALSVYHQKKEAKNGPELANAGIN